MRLFIFIVICILFTSCSSKRRLVNNSPKKTNGTQVIKDNVLVPKFAATEYINRFKNIAIAEMNQYGIPASITLAQGLLESGNGNGSLARLANNHFGIKCNSDWKGKTILQDDDQKDDCFRVYNNPEESYRDHSEFLKRKRYAFLFELDRDDYRAWANGLKQAGYATNPRYPELLVSLIDRYDLSQFDKKESSRIEKIRREDKVLEEIKTEAPQQITKEPQKAPITMKIYEVKQGDTLYSISKRFAITVDDLKILNNIPGTDIKLGQLLLVSK